MKCWTKSLPGLTTRQINKMDTLEMLVKAWPILLALITLIIVLSKIDLRVAVIEEKVRTLFDLWNKRTGK